MTADYFTAVWLETSCEVCDSPGEARVEAVNDRLEVTRVDLPECGHLPGHQINPAEAIEEAAHVLSKRLEDAAEHAAAGHL